MSEVNIKYNGSSIATMDASGTKTLLTQGKYCPANFEVTYDRPSDSGSTDFVVELNETYPYFDKTYAEVLAAYNAGKRIVVYHEWGNGLIYGVACDFYPPSEFPGELQAYAFEKPGNNVSYFQHVTYHLYENSTPTKEGGTYYYDTADLGSETAVEATPSDVTSGRVFYNSSGMQTGTR